MSFCGIIVIHKKRKELNGYKKNKTLMHVLFYQKSHAALKPFKWRRVIMVIFIIIVTDIHHYDNTFQAPQL